jgi:hypothetical protein
MIKCPVRNTSESGLIYSKVIPIDLFQLQKSKISGYILVTSTLILPSITMTFAIVGI